MEPSEIVKTIEDAGVTLTEASKILPVSRATLHNWKSGVTHGEQLRTKLASSYANLLHLAMEQGRLPLPDDMPRTERLAAIKRILRDVKGSV